MRPRVHQQSHRRSEVIAIALTGKPDHEVRARLHWTSENLRRDLAKILGAEAAASIVQAFVKAVWEEKHEREVIAAAIDLRRG